MDFQGLNFKSMINNDSDIAKFYAKNGIIFIVPYVNPWAWMNNQSVSYVDELIDVICKEYNLPDDIPIVSSGASMGGQQAIVYMAYAKRLPVSCVVNCPVCNLLYHYKERLDVPRTLYSAFGLYDMDLQSALKTASPIHIIDKLPNADYFIFHCEEDRDVNIKMHSKAFVNEVGNKLNLVFHNVAGCGHCDLTEDMWDKYHSYIADSIIK